MIKFKKGDIVAQKLKPEVHLEVKAYIDYSYTINKELFVRVDYIVEQVFPVIEKAEPFSIEQENLFLVASVDTAEHKKNGN